MLTQAGLNEQANSVSTQLQPRGAQSVVVMHGGLGAKSESVIQQLTRLHRMSSLAGLPPVQAHFPFVKSSVPPACSSLCQGFPGVSHRATRDRRNIAFAPPRAGLVADMRVMDRVNGDAAQQNGHTHPTHGIEGPEAAEFLQKVLASTATHKCGQSLNSMCRTHRIPQSVAQPSSACVA